MASVAALTGTAWSPKKQSAQTGGLSWRAWRWAGWLSLVVVLAALVIEVSRHTWGSPDTVNLVKGVPRISSCITHGVFFGCNTWNHTNSAATVAKFPLIQTGPASLIYIAGIRGTTLIGALGWLNAVVVALTALVLARWARQRAGTSVAVFTTLLFVPGMMVAYGEDTFGEPLAVAAMVGVVLSALRQDEVSAFLLPLSAIAAMSKEVAAPFVFLFGAAAILLSGAKVPTVRKAFLRLTAGCVLGYTLDVLFNLFRYGSVLNHAYLSEARSPGSMIPVNFIALLISPNGGVAWFWPGVAVAAGFLAVCAIRPKPSGGLNTRRLRAGALLGLVAFVAYALGLALWWDPFGWYAWGPRLLLPAAGPLVALAVPVLALRRFKALIRSVWAWAGLGLVAIAVLAPTLGNVFVAHTQDSMIYRTFADYRNECLIGQTNSLGTRASCVLIEEWRPESNPLVEGVPTDITKYPLFWAAFAASIISVVTWIMHAWRSIDREASPRRAVAPT